MRCNIQSQIPVDSSALPPLVDLIAHFLDQNKAEHIVKIDLHGKTDFADAMIIASGSSRLFLKALAEKLKEFLHQNNIHQVNIEGLMACDWVLIDAHDIVIHLFRPEIREIYNLEKMWSAEFQPHLKQVG